MTISSTNWNERFLSLAFEVATWSKDTTKVGAVVVDHNRNPRGFGYNGQPRGLDDLNPTRHVQPLKKLYWEHAERNVIYACARNGISCDNCCIYVTHWPCCDCTRAIIQSGITKLVVAGSTMAPDTEFYQKWCHEIVESQKMLLEVGVQTVIVDNK